MRTSHSSAFAALLLPFCVACSGSETQSSAGSEGGVATGQGGGTVAPNQGGNATVGGNSSVTTVGDAPIVVGSSTIGGATSGAATTAAGGTVPAGGSRATGGTSALGGASAKGGSSAMGGTTAKGGTSASGGTTATGGAAACATNQISVCTGTNPIVCDFGGATGDYEVTVELGGTTAGDMYVEAETLRRMLAPLTTAAGATKRFTFGVNVRQPEGQPVQAVSAGTPGLQVYIRGTAPKLAAICAKSLTPTPKVWIAGDSTVCDQDGAAFGGWGQHLPQFLSTPVSVANYADSGESSASVLGSAKMWGAIKAGWKAGDWAFVQVGHNDKDITEAAFRTNITAYVTQAKAAGVNIVLCTPISRVGYALAAEHISSTGANLPQIIRDVGTAQNVPVIDLTVTTWNWIDSLADWKPYFANGTDRTHTSPAGATIIAGYVRDAIKTQGLGLSPNLR